MIVLHPRTEASVAEYIASPAHALLLSGPNGIGKATLAQHIAESLLRPEAANQSGSIYESYPYIRRLKSEDNKAIPIDAVREIQHFLSLVVPGSKTGQVARAVVIENAELLTAEAQNALLKTLEEPPHNTVLILTANSLDNVLPTIQSRVQHLGILPPAAEELRHHFEEQGHGNEDITRALLLSGELPGLATALLNENTEHPLVMAATHARGILQSKAYERLLLVDSLSKQKDLVQNIVFIMGQMSRLALMRSTQAGSGTEKWQRILMASHTAAGQLNHNTQTKLVLTNLMLTI